MFWVPGAVIMIRDAKVDSTLDKIIELMQSIKQTNKEYYDNDCCGCKAKGDSI